MGNGDIDFMQHADGVAFDAMGEGLVVSAPFSDDAAEVKNWEEKAEETNAPETSKEITGDGLADYFMTEFLKGDEEGDGDDEPSLGRGVTLDKEQSREGEDYSVGRRVAFPNAKMYGKVRQIFDPERFDQNSFEWGVIYWINQIRDAVEEFEDGYVVPDEQFIEMLRPFKKAAKVYAEAHGKDKAWVKNTVLSVPKAFANAFDTLSDGEGVSKEHFLKVMTVEGVCALAEGDIDSVHELENYYYRKGIYSPKCGYEVGGFAVIIKDPPSRKDESERIRRIIAIRGEKGDDDPTLVFWNTSRSGIVERKASQCSRTFNKWKDACDWWFGENGDGARPLRKATVPEKGGVHSAAGDVLKLGGDMNAIAADAIEDVFGIGQDALDPNDADFWEKHDKAKHGGHFDPEKMSCKLREKYEQGEGDVNWQKRGDLNSGSQNDIISSKNQEGGIDVQAQGDDIPEQADRDEMGSGGTTVSESDKIVSRAFEIGRNFLGGSMPRPKNGYTDEQRLKFDEAVQKIVADAKSNGLWTEDIEGDFDKRYGDDDDHKMSGSEALVWIDPSRQVAVKAIALDYFTDPTLALERIQLHNKYFPHAKLKVTGFGNADYSMMDAKTSHMFKIIAEQPLVDSSQKLTNEEIRKRLENRGFKFIEDQGSAGIAVETPDGLAKIVDLHNENVFGTPDGGVVVIDCDIRKKTEDDFVKDLGKRHPDLDADKILTHLAKFKSDEEKAREFRRILSSGQITEQSNDSPDRTESPRSSVVKMAMGRDSADDRMVEFRDLLAKKFPDKDATAIISELGKIGSAEEQEAYLRRILKGG